MPSLKEKLKRASRDKAKSPVPAAESTALTRRQIQSAERVYRSLEIEEIVEALETSPDLRMMRLLDLMRDPAYDRHSFAVKCRNAGVTPGDVWQVVIEMHKLDSQVRVAKRLPKITEALADDALPQLADCRSCGGTGVKKKTVKGKETVSDCRICINGKVTVAADPEARKLALEVGGLTGQRGPLFAQQIINQGGGGRDSGMGASAAPDMSDWSRSTDAAFEERTPVSTTPLDVKEAEIVSQSVPEEKEIPES